MNGDIVEARWNDDDMYEAWSAGAGWAIGRVEVEDGELFTPTDEPGVVGRDWWDEFGHWIADLRGRAAARTEDDQ